MGKGLSGLVIVMFFGLVVFSLHYGLFALLTDNGTLTVRQIEVKGAQLVSRDAVLEASGVEEGMPLMAISLEDSAVAVGTNRMVKKARVLRYPPAKVVIEVTERRPLAVISTAGQAVTVDEEGAVVYGGAWPGLVRISLDFSPALENDRLQDEAVLALLANLNASPIAAELSEVAVKRGKGFYCVLRALPKTVFFTGSMIPGEALLARVRSVGLEMLTKKINMAYVDVREDKAIGFGEN